MKILKNRFSIICTSNTSSYAHYSSTKSRFISLHSEWIETEIHLFHKALMKESLGVPVGNLWRLASDGKQTDN